MGRHFASEYFACPCGCGFNAPDPRLVASLDELREHVGHPILVNGGCRCAAHNKAVGGEVDSQHMLGKAAHIRCAELSTSQLMYAALSVRDFEGGGIGLYLAKGFVHVDVRAGRARWSR